MTVLSLVPYPPTSLSPPAKTSRAAALLAAREQETADGALILPGGRPSRQWPRWWQASPAHSPAEALCSPPAECRSVAPLAPLLSGQFRRLLRKIKKIPFEHTCHNTGKVEENSMATNHWVKDRILNWLAKRILQ
ncbi:hypothetical protein GQ55_1G216800 [Panicum hallii var. hallii]|uniref:Uncharacterized protein n=1 Tax=Panicum hallii var. hallii TaxID=1504633 RepID=A0A2T7F6I2_9POAL|nr:hypothetical protein GQ55_1G216800 [Panicum hallii var. hallii]